jgi:hypothetical protein
MSPGAVCKAIVSSVITANPCLHKPAGNVDLPPRLGAIKAIALSPKASAMACIHHTPLVSDQKASTGIVCG